MLHKIKCHAPHGKKYSADKRRDAIVDVYNDTCSERTAMIKYGLNSWLVHTAMEAFSEFQSDCAMIMRCAIAESSQIASFYLELQAVFIDPSKTVNIILFIRDAAPSHANLFDEFGVPKQTLSCFIKKVYTSVGLTTAHQLQEKRTNQHKLIRVLVNTKTGSVGHPTQLTRHTEAIYVAMEDTEAANSKTVGRSIFLNASLIAWIVCIGNMYQAQTIHETPTANNYSSAVGRSQHQHQSTIATATSVFYFQTPLLSAGKSFAFLVQHRPKNEC
eukprot:8250876-Ditylum_brightwellii.AAC.1